MALDGIRMPDGCYADGTWELSVHVTDLNRDVTLRVTGEVHIGGVMLKLVEKLDVKKDWSDHALWWEKKRTWLLKTHWTLDKYGIQADAKLQFTPQHKLLRLQLPNMKYVKVKVNFSDRVFKAVSDICKTFNIRHPEELSLLKKPRDPTKKKKKKLDDQSEDEALELEGPLITPGSGTDVLYIGPLKGSIYSSPGLYSKTMTPTYDAHDGSPLSPTSAWFGDSALSEGNPGILAVSQPITSPEILAKMFKPQALLDKAKINQGWLDSSRSLMEQDVKENEALLLRFKYYSFFDLNPKVPRYDFWFQYHINKLSIMTSENHLNNSDKEVDEVDAALSDLEITLEGGKTSTILGDITSIPELADYIKVFKPKKLTLKGYKQYWCTFKDTSISCYKSKEESSGTPAHQMNLRGKESLECSSRLSLGDYFCCFFTLLLYLFYLMDAMVQVAEFPLQVGLLLLQLEDTLRTSCGDFSEGPLVMDITDSYDVGVVRNGGNAALGSFVECRLLLPHFHFHACIYFAWFPPKVIFCMVLAGILVCRLPQLFLCFIAIFSDCLFFSFCLLFLSSHCHLQPGYIRDLITARILEAHQNVAQMSLIEAKMRFIQAWQSLPEFGITHFIARFQGGKKEELIGIAYNRLIRMDASTGDAIKTWRFSNMKQWNVNWEIKMVTVEFADEVRLSFICTEVDCKVVHEFIGGYIFLSTRAKDQNESLDEEMFYKLTSGWV
ncbi:PREDICTED: fermitin family homolog 2 [Hipposideros armiger]|uniref:Fermitin family homolog 2 n=1 Tax=Hipposideros armiger TaxID=186990 RepID=A0A8B7RKR9_HIPAR|nr:PREDICTED: fermitin family homolog 2 [Hipposideros armiger]